MTDERLKAHNEAKLAELYPAFRAKVSRLLYAMWALGWRCRIQCAWRSPQKQLEAFKSGNSKLRFGLHCITASDGTKESLAADIIKDDDDIDPNGEDDLYHAPKSYYIALAHCAEKEGLTTGVRWGLEKPMREAVSRAVTANDSKYAGKIGWDPGHAQENIDSSAAKKGWRPK